MSGKRVREVTLGHVVVHVFASCTHVSIFKHSLEDSSSNWVMPLEHSNVSVRICSYGNGMIDDVTDRFSELFRICSFVRI